MPGIQSSKTLFAWGPLRLRGKMRMGQGTIVFSFAFDWLKGWCEIFGPIMEQSLIKPKQSCISFATQLKIALLCNVLNLFERDTCNTPARFRLNRFYGQWIVKIDWLYRILITSISFLISIFYTLWHLVLFVGIKERSFFNVDNPAVILETVKKVRKLCDVLEEINVLSCCFVFHLRRLVILARIPQIVA